MTTPTHIITGAAIGVILVNLNDNIDPFTTQLVVLSCILLSNVLDINVIWKRDLLKHHDDITHYPIFSLVISLLALLINAIYFPNTWILFQMVFISLLVHLIMDTFGARIGVHWLWPIKKDQYSFSKLKTYDKSKVTKKEYVQLFWQHAVIELVIIVALIVSISMIAFSLY